MDTNRSCQRRVKPRDVLATTTKKVPPNEKYFVHAKVGNRTVDAYVDFGSSVITIKEQVASELALVVCRTDDCVRGYGGGHVRAVGKTEPVKIRVHDYETELELLVVPDEVQAVPVIIGQPFTENEGIVIYKDSNALRFLKREEIKDVRCVLKAASTTIVPPKYTGYVKCIGGKEGEIYLERSLRLKEGAECEIPRCVLRIEESM